MTNIGCKIDEAIQLALQDGFEYFGRGLDALEVEVSAVRESLSDITCGIHHEIAEVSDQPL